MENSNCLSSSYDEIDWDNISGPLVISMTNDYLFRALLQRNNRVLTALICSLLHLKISDVNAATITNPIVLGETITDKEFMLDVFIELNRNTIIDLELQVVNEGNWPERSLCYLCRSFDNLNKGEDYTLLKPAIHIGILDFTLFQEHPEFYATYLMSNVKNHQIYSDKLRLSVLDLNCINLATEEDKYYKIVSWARFFKSTTWEELKMLAKSDKYMQEAVASVYNLTQEEKIRQQCEAREDYRRRTAGRERMLKEALEEKEQLMAEKKLWTTEREQLSSENNQLSSKNEQLSSENERLRQLLLEHGIEDK